MFSYVSGELARVQGRSQRKSALPRPTRPRRDREIASDRCAVDVIHLEAVRSALAATPPDAGLAVVSDLLGILANPTRLRILFALRPDAPRQRCELCVCDLAAVAGASKSVTSHQLRLLRTSGLVRQRRAGKLTFYRLAEGPPVSLLAGIARLAREYGPQSRASHR